jgi:DNA (cytosine-5)-methyltransferase 1
LLPSILLEEFSELGYNTLKPRVLDASDYGVPQRRRRVIFIAYLDGATIQMRSHLTMTKKLRFEMPSVI